jgi:hypothetical protein
MSVIPRPILPAARAALLVLPLTAVAGDAHEHDSDRKDTPAGAAHRQQGAHVHGVAELNLAVDGQRLLIELRSPAMNLVGFEHAPKDAEQRAAVEAARSALDDPAALFSPNAEAGCAPISHSVMFEFDDHEHGHSHEHAGGEAHSDAHAEYTFRCDHPQSLRSLRVRLFERFPGTERLEVQKVTASGQSAATLGPNDVWVGL